MSTADLTLTQDGIPLKEKLAKTTALQRRRAFLLTLPLVLFFDNQFRYSNWPDAI
jgi:hypothetical protein